MTAYRLKVIPPDGPPVVKDRTLMKSVSAYKAMVVLTGADPAVRVAAPVDYIAARTFAQRLAGMSSGIGLKHGSTGLTFVIERLG